MIYSKNAVRIEENYGVKMVSAFKKTGYFEEVFI